MITLISGKELSKYITLGRISNSALFDQELISSVLYDRETGEYYYVKKDVIAVMKLYHKLDILVQQIELNRTHRFI